jgi:hypothetical protein
MLSFASEAERETPLLSLLELELIAVNSRQIALVFEAL